MSFYKGLDITSYYINPFTALVGGKKNSGKTLVCHNVLRSYRTVFGFREKANLLYFTKNKKTNPSGSFLRGFRNSYFTATLDQAKCAANFLENDGVPCKTIFFIDTMNGKADDDAALINWVDKEIFRKNRHSRGDVVFFLFRNATNENLKRLLHQCTNLFLFKLENEDNLKVIKDTFSLESPFFEHSYQHATRGPYGYLNVNFAMGGGDRCKPILSNSIYKGPGCLDYDSRRDSISESSYEEGYGPDVLGGEMTIKIGKTTHGQRKSKRGRKPKNTPGTSAKKLK